MFSINSTLKAIRKLMVNNTPENARALAEAAGLRIKPVITNGFVKKGASRYEYIIWGVPKDGSLEELLFTQNQQGEVIATIEKAKDIKALLEDKYGVTKVRIQEVDLGGGFDFSKEIAVKSVPPAVAETSVVPTSEMLGEQADENIAHPATSATTLTPQEQAVKELAVEAPQYDEKGLLIAKLKQEIQALYAENTKKDQNRSKTSYKAKIASNSAFSSMVRHIDKKEAIIRYVENGFKLSRWDVIDFLGETIFYLTASEKVKLLQGSSSGYTMDFRQLNIAIFYLEEKLNKDYQREVKRLNIKDDNAVSQTKKIKKYKSGTREWQNFCHDESIKYARLYHSYMNDKLDYDNFIKKKELSPLSDDSIKNIENVVMRNSNKWREIDIVQFDLKPEYLENNRLDDTNHFDDIGGFNFEPMVSVDTTMQAIKKITAENTLDNARYLAMIAGLKLKEDEPSQDLDMFGEPINQDFDLFGEPIQDGDESPVEELPRLAVVELPLNKLTLSEDVPQFKSGAESDTGVVEALGGKFDRTGVAPIQVWERTDGRLEIISGRHRTDLARRSGEKTIPAQVHKESEGFTAKQAMMLDAELNIRDGQGKVKDYVDYFTHSEISEDEAERRGLIARSIGQRAFIIASKGSEELKNQHRNEIISDQAAAEISSIAPNNSAMQAVGLRVLNEHKPLNNALNTIKAVMALTREKGQEPDTFDLFGFDDSALKEAEAMARIASRKQRQIAEQLNAIKGAVKNPKLAAKHGVVVENEADALAKVQAMTAQKARWDNWSSHADLLAEVRAELNAKFDSVLDDEDDYYWLCQEELV